MRVPLERLDELARGQLEDLDELVRRAGGELGCIGAEADAEDRVAVPVLDVEELVAGVQVEDLDLALLRGRAAARGEMQIFRDVERDDAIGEAGQLVTQHAG